MIIIYNFKNLEKTGNLNQKRTVNILEIQQKEEEIMKKRKTHDKVIDIVFNQEKNSNQNIEKKNNKSIKNNILMNDFKVEKVNFDYNEISKQLIDYNDDINNFLNTNENKNADLFSKELIEKENDYYFNFSNEKQPLKIILEENILTKQFIEMNKCSMTEFETINKGIYQPGEKSQTLYIKNLHQKVIIYEKLICNHFLARGERN